MEPETQVAAIPAETAPAPKANAKIKVRLVKTAAPAAKPAKAKATRPAKPSVPLHALKSGYTGESGVVNTHVTGTEIDFAKFGTTIGAKMTDRDREELRTLRNGFERKTFIRANLDAGILRRLGQRGLVAHVEGNGVSPQTKFRLTNAAFKAA